jgi:transposase
MEELVELIQGNPDPRELKRALAVKMVVEGYLYRQIEEVLQVSDSFVSKWWQVFVTEGVKGLKMAYKGSNSYLNPVQRQAVLEWLQQKNYWNLEELQQYLESTYSVNFKSRQSYYELFSSAGISWKKTQKSNPKKDPELVEKKN